VIRFLNLDPALLFTLERNERRGFATDAKTLFNCQIVEIVKPVWELGGLVVSSVPKISQDNIDARLPTKYSKLTTKS
jgi:hypothetical protein